MKKNAVVIYFIFAWIGIANSPRIWASDHIDGPVTIANQVADIVDLYAYPTPGSPGQLTLILDVYPFVSATGHFSDKVNYNFILRKATMTKDGSRIVTDPKSEVVVTCKFITPQQGAGTQVICASNESPARIIGQIAFNQIQQPTVGNNILLFGGRRADPFFLSKNFAASYMRFQKGAPDGDNVMNNLNCLSIVINVGLDSLFPPSVVEASSLHAQKSKTSPVRKVAQVENYFIAVAAESITFDKPGASPRRIDRIGRPEITNISLNTQTADPEIRDSYNSDRPFAVPSNKASTYAARLIKNIARYDKLDDQQDWNPTDLNRIASILVEDYLVVDPFTPCTHSSFFEIESALLLRRPHQSCGGRDPNDNVVNKMYTLYEKGATEMASISVTDGLNGPQKPISNSFPYLAEPNDGIGAWLAQKIANTAKNFL